MKNKKIVLVAGKGQSSNIVFNFLNQEFEIHKVILEDRENSISFVKRRLKKLGLATVFGQILFKLLIVKWLRIFSKNRQLEIIESNKLDMSSIPLNKVEYVQNINADSTLEILEKINPDLIIVNGTRIISKKVLNTINCNFINTHAGITPMYRGVHGAYWALVNKDVENCGVTVHFVDAGIDTGKVIFQTRISPSKKDNFITYPLLQLAEGVKLLSMAINQFNTSELVAQSEKQMLSKLWTHPTLWQYIYNRIAKGVK